MADIKIKQSVGKYSYQKLVYKYSTMKNVSQCSRFISKGVL